MNYAWMCPIPLEKAVAKDGSELSGMFSVAGDSMVFVNKYGTAHRQREARSTTSSRRPSSSGTAPRPSIPILVLYRDLGSARAGPFGQRRVRPADRAARHRRRATSIKGATLDELAANIDERVGEVRRRSPAARSWRRDFLANLQADDRALQRVARRAARTSTSSRGERVVEQLFNGDVKAEPGRDEPDDVAAQRRRARTTRRWSPPARSTPRAGRRPTRRRPGARRRATSRSPGLYGVGNCVASASGRAYWAGGATLGPIIAFAYRAANAAHAEGRSAA